MGEFIDNLGYRTAAGRWLLFLTLTFRTKEYPWGRGFPRRLMPHHEFVHNFFNYMIEWLEREISQRVDFFVADQFGKIGGRLHQHIGLSSPSLVEPARELASLCLAGTRRLPDSLKLFQKMLVSKAGVNRILPWEYDAGYYIGRYIGRDAEYCDWEWRVGPEQSRPVATVGRQVLAISQVPDCTPNRFGEPSSSEYHRNLRRWHR